MKLLLKVLILTAVFIVIIKSFSPLNVDSPLVGQLAPDFTLEVTSGKMVNMTQFRDGQPAMVFFWATWCPHCRTQLKVLTKNRRAIEANGIKIMLVDVGESVQSVQKYINVNSISFDVFLDESTEIAGEYEIVGVPTFFFINREGVILDVKNALPDDYQEILLRSTPQLGNVIE